MYKHFFKRIIDFIIVFIVLLCIWWLLLVIAIWLHFVNKGAGIFFFQKDQERIRKFLKSLNLNQ